MKKIIIGLLCFVAIGVKAQNNIGLGVGSAVVAGAMITTYYVNNLNDIKSYSNINSEKQILRNVRRENAPWLFCGIGCAILSVASFSNIDLGRGLSLNFKGNGAGLSYAIK